MVSENAEDSIEKSRGAETFVIALSSDHKD